jgi:hypothetical protein
VAKRKGVPTVMDTVGAPRRAEVCVSCMPSLGAGTLAAAERVPLHKTI